MKSTRVIPTDIKGLELLRLAGLHSATCQAVKVLGDSVCFGKQETAAKELISDTGGRPSKNDNVLLISMPDLSLAHTINSLEFSQCHIYMY